MAVEIGLSEVHRMSADDYHRLIDSGSLDEDTRVDLIVLERGTPQPYHPATAALVVEVAVSSQRRDLRTKPAIYAGAGVPVYWVIDVDAGRAVAHSKPVDGAYGLVEVVTELSAPHVGLAPIAVADVLAPAGESR